MEFYTSYFYQVRFFSPGEIAFSTAVWDPKWFHEGKGQNHSFLDKRGVVNGLRAEILAPGPTCNSLCRGLENCSIKDSFQCEFLKKYKLQLSSIDFSDFNYSLNLYLTRIEKFYNLLKTKSVIFLFHETPKNPCSERWVIQEWFKENGVKIKEWEHS